MEGWWPFGLWKIGYCSQRERGFGHEFVDPERSDCPGCIKWVSWQIPSNIIVLWVVGPTVLMGGGPRGPVVDASLPPCWALISSFGNTQVKLPPAFIIIFCYLFFGIFFFFNKISKASWMNSSCQSLFSNHIRVLLKKQKQCLKKHTHTYIIVVFKDRAET